MPDPVLQRLAANPIVKRHVIKEVSFRDRVISCVCGWSARPDDVEQEWAKHVKEARQ